MKQNKKGKDKRFVQVFTEDSVLLGPDSSLIVDKETGVTYLVLRSAYGAGITPLLDKKGKPVITDVDNLNK